MKHTPILCSTHRLARSLRQAHGRRQREQALVQWEPLPAQPLTQWLDTVIGDALLCGEIDAASAPTSVPGMLQERILWEQAVEACLSGELVESLFDRSGMAAAAMEANRLMLTWRISLPGGEQTEETQQFLRWRSAFRKRCAQAAWLEPARYFEWQIDQLAAGAGRLPATVHLAGFDRLSPQEQRLLEVLVARGVNIAPWLGDLECPANARQIGLEDQEAECRAAVAWAQRQLAENPQARIAIVAPDLAAVRSRLAALLDDVLHPASVAAASADIPRCYDFSLGLPLASQPVVVTALALLRSLTRRRRVEQESLSTLLLQPYWSSGVDEADGRAQLDAAMRAELPAIVSLDRFARFARKMSDRGLRVTQLADHLEALLGLSARLPARQLPSVWALAFRGLLGASGWPGDRGLSSHEFQARQSFYDGLEGLSKLDSLLGAIDMAEAVRLFGQACGEQIFQPRAEGDPNITVMGMLESVGESVDALWVMGMNDHLWPPASRPNPLLPAAAQRAARAPNADAAVQAEFAQAIHARLLNSAPEIIFSYAHAEGDRELRASPLIAGLPALDHCQTSLTLAELLAEAPGSGLTFVQDHIAPPVAEGEHVSGGAGLLKAQAVCPAWAYFQYRLGARKLETPVEGLDAAGRGSLLHAALQCFWEGRGSEALAAMSDETLAAAVDKAVVRATQMFNSAREEPLPPRFLTLESARLQLVLLKWLAFEKTREMPFEVAACEHEIRLEIEGIAVRLVIDRIDRLASGELVILDYKTGASLDYKNWADDRITEPQLPIYASIAMAGEQVVAVAFAKVRLDETRFSGIADSQNTLPGVAALADDKARKDFPEARFADWPALVAHWKIRIEAIAREVRSGEASVCFKDEMALMYCEVKPLLRIPERKLLFERMRRPST